MGVYYLLVVLGMVVLAITNADADQSTCFVCVNQMRCDNDSQCVGVENCELLSNLCIEECVLISRQCLICSLCEENVTNTEEPATTEGKVAAAPDPQELFDSVLFNMNISMVRSARLFLSLAAAIGSNNVTNTSTLLDTFSVFLMSLSNHFPIEGRVLAASQLMRSFDLFALRIFDNRVYRRREFSLNVTTASPNTSQDGISIGGSRITLPNEVLRFPAAGSVKIASFLYNNLTGILLGNFSGSDSNETRLVSPVISSALLCDGDIVCDTSSMETKEPVRIELSHERVEVSSGERLNCVFWEFTFDGSGCVSGGEWSDRGCEMVVEDSNSTLTVCECNHLTHFAILLSPGLNISGGNAVALQVIGYIGVTVSLIALTATVMILTCVKSLWSMRSYIHVHLCLSLMTAQLVFVVGVDKTSNQTACSVVAVLLHYLYLVVFMWMLMEGVVLYVVLVKVFTSNSKKRYYLILFTVLSYGLPLLYMCVTVPLGFLIHEDPDYGYETACWLKYETHFVWSFIVPVIVIIMINSGFFVMATVIICKQKKKLNLNDSKLVSLRSWLRSSIALMVVMGLTWAVGILVFDNTLLPFAYVFTVFVAFQGLAIFIIFILMSKMVQAALIEWLRVKVNQSSYLSSRYGDKVNSWANKSRDIANPEIESKKKNSIGPQIQLGVQALKVDKCENVYKSPNVQSSQWSESQGQAVEESTYYVNPKAE